MRLRLVSVASASPSLSSYVRTPHIPTSFLLRLLLCFFITNVKLNCGSGWQGGSSTQEDVSELFTFLVVLLRCPALPLSEALFHGGKSEDSDSRISTERALYLAIPPAEEPGKPTHTCIHVMNDGRPSFRRIGASAVTLLPPG